ncbi:hypothetical protein TNCT_155591, partial [Trichonephila clavata]
VHKVFELISMLKTATAIVKTFNELLLPAMTIATNVPEPLFHVPLPSTALEETTPIYLYWQRFSDVIHRIVMDAEEQEPLS